MSPDVVDHAFIPFFTTKPTGTGIGLSLCRQIILKHGGTITVDSEESRGTTFTIKL
jgi:signal transduction histidine kinase